jgi:hypothetical protein
MQCVNTDAGPENVVLLSGENELSRGEYYTKKYTVYMH